MSENQTQAAETTETQVVGAVTELSPREKLEVALGKAQAAAEKAAATVLDLQRQINLIDTIDIIDQGFGLTIKVGRGKDVTEVQGTVLGVDRSGLDAKFKVYYGEGFNAETVVIDASKIVAVIHNPNAVA